MMQSSIQKSFNDYTAEIDKLSQVIIKEMGSIKSNVLENFRRIIVDLSFEVSYGEIDLIQHIVRMYEKHPEMIKDIPNIKNSTELGELVKAHIREELTTEGGIYDRDGADSDEE